MYIQWRVSGERWDYGQGTIFLLQVSVEDQRKRKLISGLHNLRDVSTYQYLTYRGVVTGRSRILSRPHGDNSRRYTHTLFGCRGPNSRSALTVSIQCPEVPYACVQMVLKLSSPRNCTYIESRERKYNIRRSPKKVGYRRGSTFFSLDRQMQHLVLSTLAHSSRTEISVKTMMLGCSLDVVS